MNIQKQITNLLQPYVDAEDKAVATFYERVGKLGLLPSIEGYAEYIAKASVPADDARQFLKAFETCEEKFGGIDAMLTHWLGFIKQERERFSVHIEHSSNIIHNAIENAKTEARFEMMREGGFRDGMYKQLETLIKEHLEKKKGKANHPAN